MHDLKYMGSVGLQADGSHFFPLFPLPGEKMLPVPSFQTREIAVQ